jgi:riboflavin synthase
MFTGIITHRGRIAALHHPAGGDLRLTVDSALPLEEVAIGASIAHNGVCLTVISKAATCYDVEISGETLSKTTVGSWKTGDLLNLERSLKLGDELGGHLVYGHVDGLATITDSRPEDGSTRWYFEVPGDFARFVAPKGSIALDGVSLTVNEVSGNRFGVNIVPHTAQVTSFGSYRVGDRVNFEVDIMARYVARQREVA